MTTGRTSGKSAPGGPGGNLHGLHRPRRVLGHRRPAVGRRARARRRSVRLTAAAAVLILLLLGLDIGSRALVQSAIAGRVRSATGATSVSVRIRAFPFLPSLLASGSIAGLGVTADQVPAGTVVVSRVDVEADNVRIDRHALLSHHRVEVVAVASAGITVVLTASEISSAIGHSVSISSSNGITALLQGATVPARIAIEDGHTVTVTTAGTLLGTVDLATSELIPRCDMATDVEDQTVAFSCRVEPVPRTVIDALSGLAASAQ